MGYIPYIPPSDEHPPKKDKYKPSGWLKKIEQTIKQNEQADPDFYRDPKPPWPDREPTIPATRYDYPKITPDYWITINEKRMLLGLEPLPPPTGQMRMP